MQKILVIIPTYNEAENIERVIDSVEHVSKHLAYSLSILVVDDNSPDGTAKHVRMLQKKFDNIHLLSGHKAGLGRAYIRGFQHALKHYNFDICILMDGDMSHNPDDIPNLLETIQQGVDYVIGSRYTTGAAISGDWPLRRRINSKVANFVARKLVGINNNVSDLTSGFKAMRRDALKMIDLNDINASGYIFQVSLLHAFILKGYVASEIPITFGNRSQGKSKLKMRDIIEFLYRAYKLNPNAPIQRVVRFGFVGACGAVVNLAILTFFVKFTHIDTVISVAIAIEISILFNFFLNHFYTFKGYGSYAKHTKRTSIKTFKRKVGIYNVGALGGALISLLIFTFLFKLVHLNYLVSDITAILAAMSWNYFMSTRYVWGVIDKEM